MKFDMKKGLAGLALIVSLGGCFPPYESAVQKRPEGGEAIKRPAVCEKVTMVNQDYTEWQINCLDKEGEFRYFKWKGREGKWYETAILK